MLIFSTKVYCKPIICSPLFSTIVSHRFISEFLFRKNCAVSLQRRPSDNFTHFPRNKNLYHLNCFVENGANENPKVQGPKNKVGVGRFPILTPSIFVTFVV